MSFVNLPVDPDDLPRASALELQDMAPAYRKEVLVQQAILWGSLLLMSVVPSVVIVRPEGLRQALLLVPLGLLLAAAVVVPLVDRARARKAYALRDHDIAYQSGLIFRKTVMLAFNRVQHIEISAGPLQRRFGLASLKFYTAGGSSVDLRMDGLSTETAEQLREHIMHRSTSLEHA